MMKKLLLIALMASIASVAYLPIVGKVLGPTAAYAQNDDSQGDDNDDQGDNTDTQ